MLRSKPRSARLEAQTLPLGYAVPTRVWLMRSVNTPTLICNFNRPRPIFFVFVAETKLCQIILFRTGTNGRSSIIWWMDRVEMTGIFSLVAKCFAKFLCKRGDIRQTSKIKSRWGILRVRLAQRKRSRSSTRHSGFNSEIWQLVNYEHNIKYFSESRPIKKLSWCLGGRITKAKKGKSKSYTCYWLSHVYRSAPNSS